MCTLIARTSGALPEARLRPVAVVHVPVDDRDARGAAVAQALGGERGVVEEAVAVDRSPGAAWWPGRARAGVGDRAPPRPATASAAASAAPAARRAAAGVAALAYVEPSTQTTPSGAGERVDRRDVRGGVDASRARRRSRAAPRARRRRRPAARARSPSARCAGARRSPGAARGRRSAGRARPRTARSRCRAAGSRRARRRGSAARPGPSQ